METAGPGGLETACCKDFQDDTVEIARLLRATVSNLTLLDSQGIKPDLEAVNHALADMCVCQVVNACLTYISNVLTLIYHNRPEMLISKEQIDIEWVLQFDSRNELLHALAEKRVNDLSRQSIADLEKYLKKKHSISLFVKENQRSRVVHLVDVRNLIVHNRGYINRIYKDRHPNDSIKLGDRVRYTIENFTDELIFLSEWIMDLDFRICKKFPVPTQPRIPRSKIDDIPLN